MNYNEISKSLEKKSKEDLVQILEKLTHSNPSLVSTINFYLSNMEVDDIIDLEPIQRKILSAVYGDLDYYHIDGALKKLYKVQKIAETLISNCNFKSAAEIYFLLVEGCVDAYDEGADDSSGGMGCFGEECILDFNKCMKELKDNEFKTAFIDRVLELYFREDYGFDVELMFENIVTKNNIQIIEKEFKESMDISDNNRHSNYFRNKVRRTMTNLYKIIEMPEKSLQIALKGMRTSEDYKSTAKIYVDLGRLKDALECIINGLNLNGSHKPYDMYFTIIESLINNRPSEIINIDEMMTYAISYISSFPSWSFNVKKYEWVCNLFAKLNAKKQFRKTMINKLDGVILVKVFLEENEILNAVETLKNLEGKFPNLALSIAHKAKKEGLIETARKMIILALKSGLTYINETDEHFIRELLDKDCIEDLAKTFPNNLSKKISLLLTEVFSVKAPYLIRKVIKTPEDYSGKDLLTICNNLVEKNPQDAFHLCEGWILKFVERSHVYYNNVISMLGIIKRALIQKKDEWKEYLSKFISKYKSRRKLIEMIQDAHLTSELN